MRAATEIDISTTSQSICSVRHRHFEQHRCDLWPGSEAWSAPILLLGVA